MHATTTAKALACRVEAKPSILTGLVPVFEEGEEVSVDDDGEEVEVGVAVVEEAEGVLADEVTGEEVEEEEGVFDDEVEADVVGVRVGVGVEVGEGVVEGVGAVDTM